MWGMVALLIRLLSITTSFTIVKGEPQVPCYYIFGDSLSDVGNNNDLNTSAKANYRPYGIDFPNGIPTGRFSNGINTIDRITELLGFEEYIPPFSIARGPQILKGVNYASGAAGIRSETGAHLGDRISMDQQLHNHLLTVAQLAFVGQSTVLPKCLYTVYIGSNDYINNYFMPEYYITSSLYTPEQYAEVLIQQFSGQLTTLYSYGARKVALFGLGLLGCTLAEIYTYGTNGSSCVDKINDAATLFNQKLVTLVDDLNSRLPGAQFTYIDTSSTDTGSAKVSNVSCCVQREDYQCLQNSTPCEDRDNYVFWDGFHPTQYQDILTAERAYNATASGNYVYPVDISKLVSNSSDVAVRAKATTRGYISSY